MKVKVKICGIRNEMEIKLINDFRPDYAGFIFLPNSRRFVAPEYAGLLRAKLRSNIEAVGVFYDETLETVAMTAETAGLDFVQLNGHENGEYVSALPDFLKNICQFAQKQILIESRFRYVERWQQRWRQIRLVICQSCAAEIFFIRRLESGKCYASFVIKSRAVLSGRLLRCRGEALERFSQGHEVHKHSSRIKG